MTTQLLVDALGRDAQFQMIESPSDAAAILALVKKEKPQVAVISANLGEPTPRGFDLVREIRAQSPGTRVIVLLDSLLGALSQPPLAGCLNVNGGLLSARETDVVRCVTEGLSNREIAQRLKLTEHTVKNYLFRIFDKLGVSSRVEVVLYAFRQGNAPQTSPIPSPRRLSQSVAASPGAGAKAPVAIRKTAN